MKRAACIAAMLIVGAGMTHASASTVEGDVSDGTVSILYNALTGSLTVYAPGAPLDALRITSASAQFDHEAATLPSELVDGNDVYLRTAGAERIGFVTLEDPATLTTAVGTGWRLGEVLAPSLGLADLLADLTIEYSEGGMTGKVPGDLLYGYPGDATLDGKVSEADLGILAGRWQQQGEEIGWHTADFNDDGKVTEADLGVLASRWQDVYPAVTPPSVAAVPEPATAGLILCGAIVGILRKRR